MATLTLHPTKSNLVSAKQLLTLERKGRYDEAIALFGEDWQDPAFLPNTVGLNAHEAAEILLRFGSLVGFVGYKKQISGAPERSMNILTRARESFAALGAVERTAECENYIALAYTRTGEFKEAEAWIDEALSHDLPTSSDACLYAHVTRSLSNLGQKRYKENISNGLAIESAMRQFGDAFLNGSLCSNIGVSYKNLAQPAEAMRYLRLARYFHERSRHKAYLGTVENNLAMLLKAERKFELAHEAADSAIRLYKQIKDRVREASTIDTKAQVFLVQGDWSAAIRTADRSIAMLRKSSDAAWLSESLLTKSKAQLFSDNFTDAVLNLSEAVGITRRQYSEDAARKLIKDFEAALKEKNRLTDRLQAIDTSKLELLLPPSLAKYSDYKGIWITTSNLESFGVRAGSLAIVVRGNLKRGDLAAIEEISSRQVICGIYDSEFGIVCLECGDEDPQLFNEDDVTVLGKIVGVCNNGKDENGKMIVKAIPG